MDFSRFCYVLLRNHDYLRCLNHRPTKDYIKRRKKTREKSIIWKKAMSLNGKLIYAACYYEYCWAYIDPHRTLFHFEYCQMQIRILPTCWQLFSVLLYSTIAKTFWEVRLPKLSLCFPFTSVSRFLLTVYMNCCFVSGLRFAIHDSPIHTLLGYNKSYIRHLNILVYELAKVCHIIKIGTLFCRNYLQTVDSTLKP